MSHNSGGGGGPGQRPNYYNTQQAQQQSTQALPQQAQQQQQTPYGQPSGYAPSQPAQQCVQRPYGAVSQPQYAQALQQQPLSSQQYIPQPQQQPSFPQQTQQAAYAAPTAQAPFHAPQAANSYEYAQAQQSFIPRPQQPDYVPQYSSSSPPYGPSSAFPTSATAQFGLQLGTQMFSAGQDFVSKNLDTYIPRGLFKTYFNVSNTYVLRKLLIILFPFQHRAWQRTVLRDPSGQPCGYQPPRNDINSPDLYIPVMATVTFVLLVGLVSGLRKSFHPHQLGVTASGALIFICCELVLVKVGAYLLSLDNEFYLLDMLAIIGYNFVALIVTLLVELFFGRLAKWLTFAYCGIAMGFFMLRSLRYSFLPDSSSSSLQVSQRRTRVLFLFGVVCVQILCSSLLLV